MTAICIIPLTYSVFRNTIVWKFHVADPSVGISHRGPSSVKVSIWDPTVGIRGFTQGTHFSYPLFFFFLLSLFSSPMVLFYLQIF